MQQGGSDRDGKGTLERPVIGVPTDVSPIAFDASLADDLIGRTFESGWFTLSPGHRAAFREASYIESFYPHSTEKDAVEGLYLLALLDPLASGMLCERERHHKALMYGIDRVRFTGRVEMTDRLMLRITIKRHSTRPSGYLLEFEGELRIAGAERAAMHAAWSTLYPLVAG